MKATVGLWIDHRRAVIVTVSGNGEETKEVESSVEKQLGRYSGVRSAAHFEPQHVQADDIRQRVLTDHLNVYYDEVVELTRDAEAILLFGPGEAKGELKKRLEKAKLGERIVAVQTADKMTDREIAAKVREYFQE